MVLVGSSTASLQEINPFNDPTRRITRGKSRWPNLLLRPVVTLDVIVLPCTWYYLCCCYRCWCQHKGDDLSPPCCLSFLSLSLCRLSSRLFSPSVHMDLRIALPAHRFLVPFGAGRQFESYPFPVYSSRVDVVICFKTM